MYKMTTHFLGDVFVTTFPYLKKEEERMGDKRDNLLICRGVSVVMFSSKFACVVIIGNKRHNPV